MSALEQQIIELFDQLDPDARLRIVSQLQAKQARPSATDEALERLKAVRQNMIAKYGVNHVDVQTLLDEIREDESWPRWS